MRKNLKPFGLLLFFLLLASTPLLAQETQQTPLTESRANLFMFSLIVGGGIITITASVGAICQAKAVSSACEGISRNPASGPVIRLLVIFGLVLIETLVIYALLITIIIVMVKWGAYA
jgi:F-type H+-transporting ATPase subunit c